MAYPATNLPQITQADAAAVAGLIRRVLSHEGLRRLENYHDVLIVLGEHAILPRETGDCMTAMVEFRNLLVYAHDVVGDRLA
jgi:uncharacterized protein YutE (UPF0331/DUF86 family)